MTFQPLLQPRGRVIHPTLIVLARAAILYSMHKGHDSCVLFLQSQTSHFTQTLT
jgi:hypothetical protein